MNLIDNISSSPKQSIRIQTEDNIIFQFLLQFSEINQCWFWSLAYNNWAINGCRLSLSPNILDRYKYALPFGIACITEESQVDPFRIDDFITGRIKLITMTKEEADSVRNIVYGN